MFETRRDALCDSLMGIDGIQFAKPHGAFYLFVNIEKTGLDCLEFAYKLLEREQVAVVPGVTYGPSYNGYIRIAYTLDVAQLREAASRIARFVGELAKEG